jgi:transposase
MKKTEIKLTARERSELEGFCTKGVHNVRLVNRAKIILALDTSARKENESHESIAKRIGVSRQTISNAQNDFLSSENISKFLQRKKRETPPVPPKVTGELEARIIALACSEVPKGYARWTLRLLADKCIELHYSDAISHMTIKRLLKKTNLSLI